MPVTMNINEAKANFSGMLAEVESRLATFTIMKYGRPIARVVPIERTRKIRPLPGYGTKGISLPMIPRCGRMPDELPSGHMCAHLARHGRR